MTVVVTGGTRGVGYALARAFAAAGQRVVICGRDEHVARAAAARIGSGAVGTAADVTRRTDVERLWERATGEFGAVDHWVNNAGAGMRPRLLWEAPAEGVTEVIAVNLLGSLHGSAVAIAGMLRQGHGFVWNTLGFGSNARVSRGMAAYGCSKRALDYLHRALLLETDGTPVRVGLVDPGLVLTDLVVDTGIATDELRGRRQQWYYRVLADPVDVVAPWLARRMLAASRTDARVLRLTPVRAVRRLAGAAVRERFSAARA
ncbi:SDR family oxidoreductase [Actinoplanes siamensis]|nr:SDR family oxidoreductase [Actinoplanes siamensis]